MIKINNKRCYKCNSCRNVCFRKAISDYSSGMFSYVKIDSKLCVNCGSCEKVCPIDQTFKTYDEPTTVWALQSIDESVLKASSSGGVAFEICRLALEKNYKVFATKFDENFKLIHDEVETIEKLGPFLGSKYLKSDTCNTFVRVKQYLASGLNVLYIGTPCEIGSLVVFLGGKPDNLFLIDFACHGVPSQLLFNKYKKELEKKYSSTIERVNFRSKETGWNDFSLEVVFKSGERYINSHKNDPYMQLFLRNYSLYESCYSCSFKGLALFSDITLADFWTIEKYDNSFCDDKGTSLVVVKTKNGNDFFQEISKKFNKKIINYDINSKKALMQPPKKPFLGRIAFRLFSKILSLKKLIFVCKAFDKIDIIRR